MADEFDSFLQASAGSTQDALDRRLANNRKVQTRSRRIRWGLRIAIIALGVPGIGLLAWGVDRSSMMAGIGILMLLPILPLATVLFFMGGLAPGRVRRHLSAREQQMLDD
jgi:hypothetical protein